MKIIKDILKFVVYGFLILFVAIPGIVTAFFALFIGMYYYMQFLAWFLQLIGIVIVQ